MDPGVKSRRTWGDRGIDDCRFVIIVGRCNVGTVIVNGGKCDVEASMANRVARRVDGRPSSVLSRARSRRQTNLPSFGSAAKPGAVNGANRATPADGQPSSSEHGAIIVIRVVGYRDY
jgi:hypothetical protein